MTRNNTPSCASCQSVDTEYKPMKVQFTHKGVATFIPMTVIRCADCGEDVVEAAEYEKYNLAVEAHIASTENT